MAEAWVVDGRGAEVRADRALGAVVVSAAGDALGAGYEFGPALDDDVPVEMAGGGPFGWAPGEWTDDTQTALAVLSAVADGGDVLDGVERRLRRWFDSGPVDVGNQTRAVLGRPGPLAEVAAEHAAAHPASSAGNGSLMRTGPVALAHLGDPAAVAALASDVSRLTHADPDCVDACVLWSVAIDHAIDHDSSLDGPWSWPAALLRAIRHLPAERQPIWGQRIDQAATASGPRAFPHNGWVVHASQAALAAICTTDVDGLEPGEHVVRALEACVRAGGDTDTVAAIAGALLGGRHGASCLPASWLAVLHGRRAYDEPALGVDDVEGLVGAAAAARLAEPYLGRCDRCGRRLVPNVYGYPEFELMDDSEAGRVVLGGCCVPDSGPGSACPGCSSWNPDR